MSYKGKVETTGRKGKPRPPRTLGFSLSPRLAVNGLGHRMHSHNGEAMSHKMFRSNNGETLSHKLLWTMLHGANLEPRPHLSPNLTARSLQIRCSGLGAQWLHRTALSHKILCRVILCC